MAVAVGGAFPDLKGQAPLRLKYPAQQMSSHRQPFPDLKGQAPLRRAGGLRVSEPAAAFPDLKGQAPLRRRSGRHPPAAATPFS